MCPCSQLVQWSSTRVYRMLSTQPQSELAQSSLLATLPSGHQFSIGWSASCQMKVSRTMTYQVHHNGTLVLLRKGHRLVESWNLGPSVLGREPTPSITGSESVSCNSALRKYGSYLSSASVKSLTNPQRHCPGICKVVQLVVRSTVES